MLCSLALPRVYYVWRAEAGQGTVDVAIVDPHGNREAVRPRIVRQTGDPTTYLVEYTPREEGLHQVHVWFAGQPIPSSPFPVGVAPSTPLLLLHTVLLLCLYSFFLSFFLFCGLLEALVLYTYEYIV